MIRLMPKMTNELCDEIYAVLVTKCGAPGDIGDFHGFRRYMMEPYEDREYRFMGNLGFGGKFYAGLGGGWRVDCYPENETPDLKRVIAETNLILADMLLSKVL